MNGNKVYTRKHNRSVFITTCGTFSTMFQKLLLILLERHLLYHHMKAGSNMDKYCLITDNNVRITYLKNLKSVIAIFML
jgi:hypothetical protein